MIELSRHSAAFARWQISHLLAAHYDELCTRKDVFDLAPDYGKYIRLDHEGALVCALAFDSETANCVGYSICILSPHIHYKDTLTAYEDVLFVHKDYRDGSTGARLMKFAAHCCKESGAGVLLRHAKPGTALDRILAKRQPVHEHIYAQSL